MAHVLPSKKTSSDSMTYKNAIRPYPGHRLSFRCSLARVGRLGAEYNFYLSHSYIV